MKNKTKVEKKIGNIKKMMLLLFIALYSGSLFSQQVIFKKIIDFKMYELGIHLNQNNEGGYIFTGNATATPSGMNNTYGDPSRIKTDKNGIVQWQYTYTTPYSSDLGRWIEQTPDGGYIMVADSVGGGTKTLLMKIDAAGQVQWSRHYGNYNEHLYGNCVKRTFDGGYIIGGNILSSGYHQFMLKTDSNGAQQWYKTYYAHYLDQVLQTPDSGFVAYGSVSSIGAGNMDVMLLKTDKSGTQQWVKPYGTGAIVGSGYDYAYSFDRIPEEKGYIALCYFDTCGVALLRTDTGGNVLWVNRQNEIKKSFVGSSDLVHYCNDGGYFYAITKRGTLTLPGDTSPTTNIIAVKTDAFGDTLWTREIGFQLDSSVSACSSLPTNDGGYAILGTVNLDLAVPGSDPSDYCLIKLDSLGKITSLSPFKHSTQKDVSVYPNPSNGLFNLEVNNADKKDVQVEIINTNGQLVYSTMFNNNTLQQMDLSKQPKGIYFVKVQGANIMKVEKLIIN